MSKPRVFICSTYEDLKDIRLDVMRFIESYGYEPISFEKNDIPFTPNESLEESCYDEVRQCSMLVLIIRDRLGSLAKTQPVGGTPCFSITRNEYRVARDMGVPIFVFIHTNTFNEYHVYKKQKYKSRFDFIYMESDKLAMFISEIYEEGAFRFIFKFENTDEIINTLRKQWAGLFANYLKQSITDAGIRKERVLINSFKLFFYRRSANISQSDLAKKASIAQRKLQEIEDVGIKKRHIDIEDFYSLSYEEAKRVAKAISCTVGNIRAGLPDDFLSQYLAYYFKNKGTTQRRGPSARQKILFRTKMVLFDFDGTMTCRDDNMTTWEKIWVLLGYDIRECGALHSKYSTYEITHKQWCKITEERFKAKGLRNTDLDKLANNTRLMDGVEDVIRCLNKNNVVMYIVSGSIRYIIKKVLGDMYPLIEEVKANEITFGRDSIIRSIIGTKYDFEGKATFIKQAIEDNDIHPMEAIYIGNSINDEWAHESGAQTLCVNPRMTNPYHPIQWMHCIPNMHNFRDVFQFMNLVEK